MNLHPLEYITPSSFFALSNCFLQAAFRVDASYVTFQPPAVRLGTACHSLLERVAKGVLIDAPSETWQDELESIWNEEINKQESSLLASVQERHFGRAETWPKYALQKARVFIKANKLLAYQHKRLQSGQRYGRSASERPYQAYNGRLRGRVDMILESHRGVELVDYKTGNILDEDEAGDFTIKESYRQRLLLYAAMHHDCTGVWPVRGHLVPLTGMPVSVDIDPIEAELIVQLAIQQMAQFNKCVSQVEQPADLASPSPEACRYCNYKAYCPAFWNYTFDASVWDSVAHLQVTVLDIYQQHQGRTALLVQVIAGTLPRGKYLCHTNRLDLLTKGQQVALINVRIRDGETVSDLQIHDHTVIYNSGFY
jgi:RecB family exonuclease